MRVKHSFSGLLLLFSPSRTGPPVGTLPAAVRGVPGILWSRQGRFGRAKLQKNGEKCKKLLIFLGCYNYNPYLCTRLTAQWFDSLAQLVEHNTFNVGVLGSNPKRITQTQLSDFRVAAFFLCMGRLDGGGVRQIAPEAAGSDWGIIMMLSGNGQLCREMWAELKYHRHNYEWFGVNSLTLLHRDRMVLFILNKISKIYGFVAHQELRSDIGLCSNRTYSVNGIYRSSEFG